jgi:hypothetical protein
MMKATELAEKCRKMAKNYKTVYMWGTYGSIVTDKLIKQKSKQYPNYYTAENKKQLSRYVGKGYWATDCSGLLKMMLWGWKGDANKSYGGAVYASNGVPDISADQMIEKCTGISTNFSGIQIGELLWCKGHVGIYIGSGLAVECTPKWDGDVQITAVGNIGKKSGYNTRTWKKHGKLPYVTYTKSSAPTTSSKSQTAKLEPAKAFDAAYAKTYTVSAVWLNMRKGAGATKGIIKTIPKGRKVKCYGYYTKNGSTPWLYVVDQKTGATGYCSKKYLK